jgi:hypothetical protein
MILRELFEAPQPCPECGGISFSDLILAEKKDACYYKIKASAKVWPSAYASGRLVQCRKKGAANYGNKSEGVAEGSLEELANTSLDVKEPKDFVNTNDRKQVTYKVMKFKSGKDTYLINFTVKGAPAFGKKQNWNAVNVAFGVKEKQDDYSFGDEMNTDLTGKNKNQFLIYSTVINAVRKFITEYNTEIDEIIMQGAGERQEAMYQRFFQSAGKYFPGWHYNGKHSLVRDVPRPTGKKVKEEGVAEEWSQKYKSSINCSHPKGFSQKAHCAGKKKHNESVETEMVCEDCGMCETHADHKNLDEACWQGYHKEGNKKMFGKTYPNCVKNESMAANAVPQLSVPQLAAISDEALDKAYGYGRSTPGNTFGYQANLKSAAYAKQMIDQGVTDIEAISNAIHKGWNVTAQAFVQNPKQFDDTAKLAAAGKLEAKLQQRAQLMKQNYAQLPEEEKEKDRVVARALLQAIRGEQGMAEGVRDLEYDAQSLITKLRRDVEEKRLQPTRQAVLMAARELAGDMDFAPELLVQQVLGRGMAEGNRKSEPPEADYGADYQDMVARVKHLAGLGPLKTVWDPQKRVYKNVPVAVQPKK